MFKNIIPDKGMLLICDKLTFWMLLFTNEVRNMFNY